MAAVALASGAPELPEPERGLAPETTPDVDPARTAEPCIATAAAPLPTPSTAGRAEGDLAAETVDREVAPKAKFHRDLRTRRMALKSAVVLGILAVPAMGTWLLNRPPVVIQGWSRALAPPSLIPSRNAPNSVAIAIPRLPEAASQAASGALESGGAFTRTAPDGVRSAAPAVADLSPIVLRSRRRQPRRPPLPRPKTRGCFRRREIRMHCPRSSLQRRHLHRPPQPRCRNRRRSRAAPVSSVRRAPSSLSTAACRPSAAIQDGRTTPTASACVPPTTSTEQEPRPDSPRLMLGIF